MDKDTSTTVAGLLKGVAVATATLQGAESQVVFYLGLVYAVLTAVQGYLTNKPE